jgi:hypothetical protein
LFLRRRTKRQFFFFDNSVMSRTCEYVTNIQENSISSGILKYITRQVLARICTLNCCRLVITYHSFSVWQLTGAPHDTWYMNWSIKLWRGWFGLTEENNGKIKCQVGLSPWPLIWLVHIILIIYHKYSLHHCLYA